MLYTVIQIDEKDCMRAKFVLKYTLKVRGFDIPGDVELPADVLEGHGHSAVEPEPQLQHLSLPLQANRKMRNTLLTPVHMSNVAGELNYCNQRLEMTASPVQESQHVRTSAQVGYQLSVRIQQVPRLLH
jgi:hypothetical protein